MVADRTKRALAAQHALRVYGKDVTQEQLLRLYAAENALHPVVRKNVEGALLFGRQTYDHFDKRGAEALDSAVVWGCAGDAAAAMKLAAQDALLDHGAEEAEDAKLIAATAALVRGGKSVKDALFAATELVSEEGRTARVVLDARNLLHDDAKRAPQRMAWRYGQDEASVARLSRIVLDILTDAQPEDAVHAALCALAAGEIPALESVEERAEGQPKVSMGITMMGAGWLVPGKARQCLLDIRNDGDRPLFGPVKTVAEGTMTAMTVPYAKVMQGESARIPFTIWLPEEAEVIAERNVFTVSLGAASARFGVNGSVGWLVRGRFDGEDWGAWEAHFAKGSALFLDELTGRGGRCEMQCKRVLRVEESVDVTLKVEHTCAVKCELDGKLLCDARETDGWSAETEEIHVHLKKGKHTLFLSAVRGMPQGRVDVQWWKDDALFPMRAENPLRGV